MATTKELIELKCLIEQASLSIEINSARVKRVNNLISKLTPVELFEIYQYSLIMEVVNYSNRFLQKDL